MAMRRWMASVVVVVAAVVALARGSQCSALEENVDYPGNDIQTISRTTPDGCCTACLSTPACAMYIYSDGSCWLKNATNSMPSRITGKYAGFVHRSQCGVIYNNTAAYDVRILAQTNRTRAESCCSDCAATLGCSVWTWRNTTPWEERGKVDRGICWLFTTSADLFPANQGRFLFPDQRAGTHTAKYVLEPGITTTAPHVATSQSPWTSPPSRSIPGHPSTTVVALAIAGTTVVCVGLVCYFRRRRNEPFPPAIPLRTTDTPLRPEYQNLGRRRQHINQTFHSWRCNICAFDNSSEKGACVLCETTRGTLLRHPDQLNALQHSAWSRHQWLRSINKYDGLAMWTQRPTHALPDSPSYFVIRASPRQSPSHPFQLSWQPLTRESASTTVTGTDLPAGWLDEDDPTADVREPFLDKYATALIHWTDTVTDTTRIKVNRHAVWPESVAILLSIRRESLASKTKVHFLGEDGVDAGGVQREWYSLMADAFVARGLFVVQANRSLSLNPVYPNATHFLALGRFLGRAILDGQVLPLPLSVPLFKTLVGAPLSVHDVRYVDETTYASLLHVRDSACVEALDLDFTWTRADGRTVELVAGGRDMSVTAFNQAAYVAALVRHWLLGAAQTAVQEVVRGFYDVLSPAVVCRFDYKELELVVCGSSEINVVEWRFESVASPELAASPVVEWFWDVVERDMRPHERAKLLQFATGSSRVPLQGFKALTSNDGQLCPFNLRAVPYTGGALPRVHTCFNRIVLPLYPTRTLLRDALFLLVNMEVRDFTIE